VAVAYARLADLQADGSAAHASVALASYRRSYDLFAMLARTHADNAQAQRDLAASQSRLTEFERVRGR
jgi:hypothetical protein